MLRTLTENQTIKSPTSAKQRTIADYFRQQIVDGALPPGARLPTQVQLVEQLHVSGVTVQRALDRLIHEGFICAKGRNGTFVVENPPHLCQFGLVFGDAALPDKHRSNYHTMLEYQAHQFWRSGERTLRVFNDMSGYQDTEVARQLVMLLRTHRMAGVILVDADTLHGSSLLEEPGICRVGLMSRQTPGVECPIVFPDIAGMVDLGVETLIQKNRTRIAVLITAPLYKEVGGHLRQALQNRGISLPERWMQIVPHDLPEAVRNTVLMMMSEGQTERPDGIFIADDNLVEGALSGLIAAGVEVPTQVEVVAHCNFPGLTSPILPIQRVGFNTRQLIEAAVKIIDQQRQGEMVDLLTRIPAVLETVR